MKNKYRIIEICALLYFVMFYSIPLFSFSTYINIAKVDAWFSPMIGCLLGAIPFGIYIGIINYKEELNIHQKNIQLFGKIIGTIINIILILCFCYLLLETIYFLINFICSEYLYNTPKYFVLFFFVICFIYLFSKNFKILCRSNIIFAILCMIVFIISTLGLIMQFKLDNWMPFFEHGMQNSIVAAISGISHIVLPTFVISMIPKSRIQNKKKYTKYLWITYLVGSLSIILVVSVTISIFGIELSSLYEYPVFHILKRVLISTVFERLESILAIQYILFSFVVIMLFIFYIMSGLEITANLKGCKFKNIIYSLLIIIFSIIGTSLFKNNTVAFNFVTYITPYILCFCLFIIPLIIFLKIKFSKKTT